ncbi:receptor-interacting serine/threonine-protein kinase 4 isoform X2 [Eurytemora carolleeae]|uniref:receptor-interacting serine/threonine-protein kinase 4 isoform X2 n=1 Tax=Eurytemora carolleeae TaxID=1294199 RepID=UPI000C789F9E|nr:receptor-interacting serine/threonine-protein kinase 4 isoform X2 [Eurytemora carolleeae]|eukprot:XP_023336598.1 receptor-interacting serine/threonine-protein kinase 4-like isoform X2 [Eurytemora affinis]
MSLREVVRRSRRTLFQGKEQATARLSSAFSMGSIHGIQQNSGRPVQRNDKGWTVLHLAAMYSKPQTVRLLLQQGCKSSDKDIDGNTPLHLAAEFGNREAVRILLHNGGKVNERNNEGFTPLHLASKAGKEDVVHLILQQNDINVDEKSSAGNRTALHLAAAYGRTEVVRALIQAGASTRCKASLGWTCLHFSAREGRLETAKVLLRSGARLDMVTTGQWTPLMFAAAHNQIQVAKLFIQHGADVAKVNRDGLSAESIAAGKGYSRMVSVLRGEDNHSSDPSADDSLAIHPLSSSRLDICQAEEPTAELSNDAENIEMNEDEKQAFQYLNLQLSNLIQDLTKHKEDSSLMLSEKEEKIISISNKLMESKLLEERLSQDLEKVRKDVQDLTVKEAVAKNAFEKSAKAGKDQVTQLERHIVNVKREIIGLCEISKQRIASEYRENQDGPERSVNISRSSHSINIESEIECPICFELSRPPIFQCPEGHIICSECRPRVSRCPVCRFEFKGLPNIRNRYVERLALSYFEEEEQ